MDAKVAFTSQPRYAVPRVSRSDSGFKRSSGGYLAGVCAAIIMLSGPAFAAMKPSLGAAESFSVLAALSMSAAAPGTTVSGDLGLSPGLAVSRTGNWTVGGSEYFGPSSLAFTAQANALSAFNNLAGQGTDGPWGTTPWSPGPGTYTVAGDTTFTGTITLTGSFSDVWVFQVGSDMTFDGSVILAEDAQACNVFWQIGRDATIAAGSAFVGTLIASRDVSVVSGASVNGRIISLNSSLTTDGNTISGPTCLAGPGIAATTVSTVASADVVLGGQVSDTATLIGGDDPTGTIDFSLYGPADATCSGTPVFTSQVAVNGNGIYSSGSFTPTAIGLYRWIANYSGDDNNAPTTNVCNELNESVNVTAVPPVTSIPTLSEWAMILLAMLLAIVGFTAMRRRDA